MEDSSQNSESSSDGGQYGDYHINGGGSNESSEASRDGDLASDSSDSSKTESAKLSQHGELGRDSCESDVRSLLAKTSQNGEAAREFAEDAREDEVIIIIEEDSPCETEDVVKYSSQGKDGPSPGPDVAGNHAGSAPTSKEVPNRHRESEASATSAAKPLMRSNDMADSDDEESFYQRRLGQGIEPTDDDVNAAMHVLCWVYDANREQITQMVKEKVKEDIENDILVEEIRTHR